MLTEEFIKDCIRINNPSKSLGYGHSFLYNKQEEVLICIGNKPLKRFFFCTIQEVQEDGITKYNLFLLKNDDPSTKELVSIFNNSNEIRKILIDIIKRMYPLTEDKYANDYCYPKQKK